MFGMLMWEAFACSELYPDIEDNGSIKRRVIKGELRPAKLRLITNQQVNQHSAANNNQEERVIKSCPLEMWELMSDCWKQDPESRPTMEEVHNRLYKSKYYATFEL
jgi:hypothetical protein